MNQLKLLAKPLLAGFLCLLLASELLLPDRLAQSPPLPVAVRAPASAAPGNTGPADWAAAALARPLFNAGRRPVQPPSTVTATPLPRLTAIIVSNGARKAIFATDGPLPQVVSQGGQIDGYEVLAILPDSVNITGPDGRQTLRPQFDDGFQSDPPVDTPDNAPNVSSANPPPPPPPVPTAASRLDDDPI